MSSRPSAPGNKPPGTPRPLWETRKTATSTTLSARPMPAPASVPRAPGFAPPAPPPPPLPSTANPFDGVSNTALNLVVDSRMAEEEPPGVSQQPVRGLTPIELAELLPPPPWLARARRLARRSWPLLAAGLAASLALAIWGGGRTTKLPAAAIGAPVPERVAPVEVPGERPAAPVDPAPAAAVPDPRSAGCTVRVTSKPRGAVVRLGRDRLGRTPLAAASIPCGQVRLSISHPRFRRTSAVVRAAADSPARARVVLRRPSAQLQLVSVPAGASFTVNGRPVGPGPARVKVSRFERVRIEATLPGRTTAAWRQTLFVRHPVVKVRARITSATGR